MLAGLTRVQDSAGQEATFALLRTNIQQLELMKQLLDIELPNASEQDRWTFVGQHLIADQVVKEQWPQHLPTWIPVR